ncbi:hypothetical protein FIU87_05960 [Bacillus sp. THAF10]|uniref:DUF4825 domain-containing protein n=1 Tax=Bacillus sp. THAF10 TaxID=2587848 RepID=UPI001268E4E3|nr:DUF4825 domain-containing protein [Bacillus sp. THAF10]QFT88178.1 hypothetical protein FIU87_05960 [Bacillus sp. THAF10]
MKNNVDQRLKSIPKPTLGEEKKHIIHQNILNTNEQVKGGTMMSKLKPVYMMAASVAAVALFFFIILNTNVVDNPNMSGDNPQQTSKTYVEFLGKIEVHEQINPETAFIGNAGSLITFHGNILPGKYYADGMELETSEDAPMGINMNYLINEDNSAKGFDREVFSEKNLPYTLLFNATAYFTFFKNGEFVNFHINDGMETKTYSVTREQIEGLYEKDVQDFQSDLQAWEQEVMENVLMDSDKVQDFFTEITSKGE